MWRKKISTGQKIKKLTAEIPQKIMIKKLTAGKKKFKVKFNSINNAVKYQIQYSLKKRVKSAKVKTVTKTTNTIKKLKSKKKYYVRVRAINIQGKEGSWSKVSRFKENRNVKLIKNQDTRICILCLDFFISKYY